jgi:hypothetical protein
MTAHDNTLYAHDLAQRARTALACLDLTSLNDGTTPTPMSPALPARPKPVWRGGGGVRLAATGGVCPRPTACPHQRGGGGQFSAWQQRRGRGSARHFADCAGRCAGGGCGAALPRADGGRRGQRDPAAVRSAPGLPGADAQGDSGNRCAANHHADRACQRAGAGCRGRLSENQHRQNRHPCHRGGGGHHARRDCQPQQFSRIQGVRRHPDGEGRDPLRIPDGPHPG